MERNGPNEITFNKIPEIAKLGAYIIFLSVLLGLIEAEFYYQLLLHIPIFQYMDASEVVLFSPGTGITLLIYYLGIFLLGYFAKEHTLNWFTKSVTLAITISLTIVFFKIAYNNDQVIKEMTRLPLNHWWYIIAIVILVVAYGEFLPGVKDFTIKHSQFKPILIAFWYGLVVAYLNYYVLTESQTILKVNVKLKSGVKFSTSKNLIFAGKTKNYWFFYNRKSKFTRILKEEEISTADFDSANN